MGVVGDSSALRSVRTLVCCVSCQRELEAAQLNPQVPEGSGRVSHRDPTSVHASPGAGGLRRSTQPCPAWKPGPQQAPARSAGNGMEFTPKCLGGDFKFSNRENSSH